ncbi:alpha-ketoglutarate-dependent dioxygenase AlkB [Sphingobium sp. BHU LFT2]|uniref:alpha-ketoglutarate-dependent dioxygenase AlkB family protein n=1 Tax=Sphingobium sp. BHU LFT2 TaxID=2807634 RepID=UPI001BEB42D5|nr:alpha-ketoglutarate-dependent dioxygenase AlkB [Sphingobium sp. BHU LFT2]MBT2244630.1 alpha-ketoglutarate-dependent dioxygenase AlkB [Sphingobium sp. BHU LFT2]
MMADLFSSDISFSRIAMEDADVQFLQRLPMHQSDESIFEQLFRETKWLHEKVMVWGKEHYQPRLTAWYGDPGRSYTYSGTVMFPLPWTNLLLSLRRELQELTDARFNSVLLNLYRDHNDRMGFHSDNEPSLGQEPTIASLSYGATRTLIFKHKKRQDLERKRIPLVSGCVLLMSGGTQRNWVHGIDKESRPCGPRINLTFRNILK